MIPGIGRFDAGNMSGGGFEVVIGIGSYQETRDQMLLMYRQHNIAPRGMHVTNKSIDAGPAELAGGGEMTMEMRQAVAKAREEAGYSLLPVGAEVKEVDHDLSKNEAYLDGIVEAPNWGEIGRDIDDRLTPMTVVMTRELACPSAEVADRVNREFWERFGREPSDCIDLVRGFASAYIPTSSRLLSVWPPEVIDSFTTDITYSAVNGERHAQLEKYTVSRAVTRQELKEQGLTLRNWFAKTLAAEIIEMLDNTFSDALATQSVMHIVGCEAGEHLIELVRGELGGDPEAWIRDTVAHDRMGLVPGQVLENIPGVQCICEEVGPFEPGTVIARGGKPGHHRELPDAFEVEIEQDNENADRLTFTLNYWHALDIDPDAHGFAVVHIGE